MVEVKRRLLEVAKMGADVEFRLEDAPGIPFRSVGFLLQSHCLQSDFFG